MYRSADSSVGASILAINVRQLGCTREAVGAYNATSPALRQAYVERVYRQAAATRAPPQPSPPTVAAHGHFPRRSRRARNSACACPHPFPDRCPLPALPASIQKGLPMNPSHRIALIMPMVFGLALGASSAFAGTTGAEIQTLYTTLLNWVTGYLGKAIAVVAFILGAGIGMARSSLIPLRVCRSGQFLDHIGVPTQAPRTSPRHAGPPL